MISYTCDNCGAVLPSPSGLLPPGWYAFGITVQLPPATDAEGTVLPPGPPEVYAEHADKLECYNAMVGKVKKA